MTYVTPADVQAHLFSAFDDSPVMHDMVGEKLQTDIGLFTVVRRFVDCDHEPCYETHDVQLVVSLDGRRFFQRKGTYSSQDGTTWTGPVTEVKPVQKVVQDWADVPAAVWDLKEINRFLKAWMGEQPGTGWSGLDWTTLFYKANGDTSRNGEVGLDIEDFPWTVYGIESWTPGDAEYSGPVFLIFRIDGKFYSLEGRNVSHSGWDFDNYTDLVPVSKKTKTVEVWDADSL